MDRDHNRLAACTGHLYIVGRTEAGIRHLHHACLRVCGGGPRLFRLLAITALVVELLSLALYLGKCPLCRLPPPAAFLRRTLFTGPDAPIAWKRRHQPAPDPVN